MFEFWVNTDLNRMPLPVTVAGRVFSHDSTANKIGVRVTRDNEETELSGTVKAYIVKPDRTTIEADGDLSGNRAWVILPESAYALPGRIGIYIKLINETETTTLAAVEGTVYRSRTASVVG